MYCGGKKYPPSSHTSIINSVFPGSWFSKIKPRTTNPTPIPDKNQPDFLTQNPPAPPDLPGEGRFYGGDGDDDDGYWRLSFREGTREHAKGITWIPPASPRWPDVEDGGVVPVQGFTRFDSKSSVMRGDDACKPRMISRHDESGEEKVIFPVETPSRSRMKKEFHHSPAADDDFSELSHSPVDEDYELSDETSDGSDNSPTKSHRRKTKRNNRAAKSCSPRWELRAQALENVNKTRIRPRRKEAKVGGTMFDSFAQVKTSYDPQEDFRQSMAEMICDQEIRRPEELEELLACYLTLNGDEHHDLIIRVFQEVWFELSAVGLF